LFSWPVVQLFSYSVAQFVSYHAAQLANWTTGQLANWTTGQLDNWTTGQLFKQGRGDDRFGPPRTLCGHPARARTAAKFQAIHRFLSLSNRPVSFQVIAA